MTMEDNMAYKTDGSSHTTGIKNEENLIERLQKTARTLYPQLSDDFKVVKRGGTKFKQDMEIVDGGTTILISAKKKTDIKTGSFDWVNSSSATKTIPCLKEFAKTVKDIGDLHDLKGSAKLGVLNASHKALGELTSEDVRSILQEHVSNKNKGMKVVISETTTGNNWEYDFEDSPLNNSIQNHTPRVQLGDGIDSAKIMFEDDEGNTIDHGLRIRVVTNNGIGALIGKSKANKSSQGVVKIQQDNIPGLISGLGNKIRKF
jgi:hypothetical protein